jgi:fructose-specific phosphotransferase system IIC component
METSTRIGGALPLAGGRPSNVLSENMIIDAIIALFASLFGVLVEGVTMTFVPLINLIAAGIEAVIGIFVSGFHLGRINRKRDQLKSNVSAIGGILTLLAILGLIGWFVVMPTVLSRKVTLVAEDGHSLPFAALIVHTGNGAQHLRTDNSGNIVIPRFDTNSVKVKDPRYVEKTWAKSEIEAELVVERTVLGAGLDSLADRLLKRTKE